MKENGVAYGHNAPPVDEEDLADEFSDKHCQTIAKLNEKTKISKMLLVRCSPMKAESNSTTYPARR